MSENKIVELIKIAEAAGDFEESLRLHKELAEQGNVVAMSEVGSLYMMGKGVEKNDAEGFKWIKRAAESGNVASMAMLARMYELGVGVEPDINEALKWYVDAANAGEEPPTSRHVV